MDLSLTTTIFFTMDCHKPTAALDQSIGQKHNHWVAAKLERPTPAVVWKSIKPHFSSLSVLLRSDHWPSYSRHGWEDWLLVTNLILDGSGYVLDTYVSSFFFGKIKAVIWKMGKQHCNSFMCCLITWWYKIRWFHSPDSSLLPWIFHLFIFWLSWRDILLVFVLFHWPVWPDRRTSVKST